MNIQINNAQCLEDVKMAYAAVKYSIDTDLDYKKKLWIKNSMGKIEAKCAVTRFNKNTFTVDIFSIYDKSL